MRFGPVYLELCLRAHPVVAAVELVFHLLFSDSYNHYWRKFVPGNSTDVPLDSGKQNCELNCLLIIYFSVVERTLSGTKKNAQFFLKQSMKVIHQIAFILMIYFPTLRLQIYLTYLVKNTYQSHTIVKMFLPKTKNVMYIYKWLYVQKYLYRNFREIIFIINRRNINKFLNLLIIRSDQSLSPVRLFATP